MGLAGGRKIAMACSMRDTVVRDPIRRGLERAYAGKVGRFAHRATTVAAQSCGRKSGCDSCRRRSSPQQFAPHPMGGVRPVCRLSSHRPSGNSGQLVVPRISAPACIARSTTVAFSRGTWVAVQQAAEPAPVSAAIDALMVIEARTEAAGAAHPAMCVPVRALAPVQSRPAHEVEDSSVRFARCIHPPVPAERFVSA